MTITNNKVLFGNGTIAIFNYIDSRGIGVLELKEVPKGNLGEFIKIQYPEYYSYNEVVLYFDNINSIDSLIGHLENLKRNL